MKEFLDKLSSYNIFNYLFPGIVFVVIVEKVTRFSFTQEDLIIGLFIYYFIGLVISRFGSLAIEPLMRKTGVIKFASYDDYLRACKKDDKVELFSEVNNMYRTLLALFVLVASLRLYQFLAIEFSIPTNLDLWILITLLMLVFFFSYKKQTEYVVKRIRAAVKKKES